MKGETERLLDELERETARASHGRKQQKVDPRSGNRRRLEDECRQARRLITLTRDLVEGRAITSRYIRETHGVSRPTANRDMYLLELALPVRISPHTHTESRVLRYRS